MLRRNRTAILLQSQIENAMKVTRSNRAAAEFLRVSYKLYCKFAKTYKNAEGITLFQAHMNQAGRGISKMSPAVQRFPLDEILMGKHPQYSTEKLLRRMVVSGYIVEQCNHCGYSQKRPTDQKTPLILHHIDGNKRNHKAANLELLCYNCYFMLVGNLRVHKEYNDRPEHKDDIARLQQRNPEEVNLNTNFEILTDQEKIDLIKGLSKI